jgi:hypothetical protein
MTIVLHKLIETQKAASGDAAFRKPNLTTIH